MLTTTAFGRTIARVTSESHEKRNAGRLPFLLAVAALVAATVAAYHGVVNLGFVYDDKPYIVYNTNLLRGTLLENLSWSSTATLLGSWHPLTWVSHVVCVRLFGLHPAGHHVVNLLLHLAATLLLLRALHRFTGSFWTSALAAALFALHPLHVESVAWVSERKDVLSAVFWMLTLVAYGRYCSRPGPARYAGVLAGYILAVMAKPMAITLPLVLLLLDFWPLGRWLQQPLARTARRLVGEKLPFFAIATAVSLVAVAAQRNARALYAPQGYDVAAKAANACVAYATYIVKTFWPHPLAVYYPIPLAGHSAWLVAGSALLLLTLTATALLFWRRLPFLAVGWLWFLVSLVPVAGFVQVGMHAMADRYVYLPHVGLFAAMAWAVAHACGRRGRAALAAGGIASVLLLPFAALTSEQVEIWRSDVTLFGHAVAVYQGDWLMHYFYAISLARNERLGDAVAEYGRTLQLQPRHEDARFDLAQLLERLGRFREAAEQYQRLVDIAPASARAHKGLGATLEIEGRLDEAAAHYRTAARLEPGNAFYRALADMSLARQHPDANPAGPGSAQDTPARKAQR